MSKKTRSRRIAIGAAIAAALTAVTLLIVLSVGATTPQPTINFKCLNFNLMDDGSIQAVVTISAEDLPYLASTYFNIAYNEKYIQPSNAVTNAPLSPDGENKETSVFFAQDQALYLPGRSPFMNKYSLGGGKELQIGMVGKTATDRLLSMALYLDTENIRPSDKKYSTPTGEIKWLTQYEGQDVDSPAHGDTKDNQPYIAADGKVDDKGGGAVIGTISFRVNPDNLTEMVRRFKDGVMDTTTPAGEKKYLLGLAGLLQGDANWGAIEYYYEDGQRDTKIYSPASAPDMIQFQAIFPRVLVKAKPAVEAVTVSAYEAYTVGDYTDLAAVLRKHSPAVRAGYADGSFEDFVMPWGAADTATETREYKIYRVNSDGTETLLAPADYSPEGGTYRIKQYFFYSEGVDAAGKPITKRFPLFMEVKLVVKPVEAVGISGVNLTRTYLNDGSSTAPVPAYFSKLGLPGEATLVVTPLPGTTSLTLPLDVTKWSNYDAELKKTTAKDNGTKWPIDTNNAGQITPNTGAGVYEFNYGLSQTEIKAAYPWLSKVAQGGYTLNANRTIVLANLVDPADYAVTAARTGQLDENAVFTVTKNGAAVTNAQSLALHFPNGQAVATGATADLAAGTITTTANDVTDTELRRYLNLGGWFAVELTESGAPESSGRLPVYLPPRDNRYLEDNTFEFTGFNAGIFPYRAANKLGSTVVLPAGYFTTTTYSGMDGAPGGRLATIRADWAATDPKQGTTQDTARQYTYGAQQYASGWFDGFGRVNNTDNKAVTLSVEDQTPAPPDIPDALSLSLTCAPGTPGVAFNGDQVTGLVYNTRQKGYQTRQEFTLTLENNGTRDIYGLSLNLPANNHFEIIKAPAAFLTPGTKTTFVVTYLYNMEPANATMTGETFRDTIQITANEKGGAPIKSFTAQFRVTHGPVSTVKVVTNEKVTPKIMGDAGLIIGLPEGDPTAITDGVATGTVLPDLSAGPTDYEAGYQYVWVRSELYDEYEVAEVYYYKNNVETVANKVTLNRYDCTGAGGVGDRVDYWFFAMPDDDVVVHVDFMEPVLSKLRLSHLLPEADLDDGTGMTERDLRRYDNNAKTTNNGKPLTMAESSLDHFLVVLGTGDKRAQLTLQLREVIAGVNGNIPVDISVMEGADPANLSNPILTVVAANTDPASNKNRHSTADFAAPAPGASTHVVITLSHTYTLPDNTPKTESRKFTVTFAKPPATVAVKLGYGNSPYGMIMNDMAMADGDKASAKADFDKNRAFTPGSLTPAKAAGLTNRYLTDAWGSGTDYDKDETALFVYPGEPFEDPNMLKVQDSANKPVSGADISRTVEVTLLDTTATTQVGRFSGTSTVTLDLGTADPANNTLTDWWKDPLTNADYFIRPGVYELVYTFNDYDEQPKSFTRPFIVLPRNGDVNADMTIGSTDPAGPTAPDDARIIENRVTDPMGYTAEATAYPDWALFRYRVCDPNNDGNFNNIDANLVRDASKLVHFYKPTDYK